MLSYSSIKEQKGLSQIAIIIIALVVLAVIIGGILIFITVSSMKQPTENQTNTLEESLVDTDTEITLTEKNKLKNDYLGVFAIISSDKYQTDSERLIETASKIISMSKGEVTTSNTTSSMSTSTNTDDVNNTVSVASETTSSQFTDTSSTQSMVNGTIVITENSNPIENSTSIENSVNNTSVTNSVGSTISGGLQNDNTELNKDDVEKAINEINSSSVDELSDLLSSWNDANDITPAYVTDIVSISKTNGVYDITYKVCWPKEKDLVKFGTMDKMNTAAVDAMDKTIINIQLIKNVSYEFSEYKVMSISQEGTETASSYYLTYSEGKYGVIDQDGNEVLQAKYDFIDIPNNYKDIFVCKTGTNSVVLNKEGTQIYTDYENISLIESTAGGDTRWYEKDFLVYQKDGKYGAIDYDGFEIFEPIYDSIEPLYYIEGEIILTENGMKTLANITGKLEGNFKYKKVGVLGGQFDLSAMVTSQRTLEEVQQMVQTKVFVLGEDINGTVETIKSYTPEMFAVDFSSLPQFVYSPTISMWQLRSLEGGSIGRIQGTYYLVYIK